MAVPVTGQAPQTIPPPTSFAPGVSSGVRQALALVGGALETNQTIRREARFVERREPAPFERDRIDVRADGEAPPEPAATRRDEPALRKLSLTGQPEAERDPPRGNLVDIET
jgi:hypothetical protein